MSVRSEEFHEAEMIDQDNPLKEFLIESSENLDQLDRDLVALEQEPGDRERLASIFRTVHTIKGTCGFLDLTKLEEVAHVGEHLLSRLREGYLTLDAERTSALLALGDVIRELLARIENEGQEGDGDYRPLIERLTRLSEPDPGPAEERAGASRDDTRESGRCDGKTESARERSSDGLPTAPTAPGWEPQSLGVARESIRVDVGLLDRVMNLVGELVLARNQLLQLSTGQSDPALLGTSQRLNLITTELQEGVTKTRMQPIGMIWTKLPRLVRDLALACGKRVRIEIEGKETGLDRTLIEAIKDPLTHLLRNAVDHGIEAPDVRLARGKPAEGRMLLRAFHEGGLVNIELSDDGAGIDPWRIRRKALDCGLIAPEQAARMSDREALSLIFLSGFSTAEQVTTVSGRGVGMDVVRNNIEKCGGTVDLESRLGQGTVVKIKIPLTLAIIPVLIVTCGKDRFAIPQVSLVELVRLDGEQARRVIETVHDTPLYRLRDRLLPLVALERTLKLEAATPRPAADPDAVNIVVLQADGRHFGLVVERIHDTEEIVVKPLSKHFKGLAYFAGATILGDGGVALILDVPGVARAAGVVSGVRERSAAGHSVESTEGKEARQKLLLVSAGEGRRMGIPLPWVDRLEEIPREAVEWTAEREVIQYRGRILPLIRVSEVLPGAPANAAADWDTLQVVVASERGRNIGLVVERIIDVVETPLDIQTSGGTAASAVIQQRVTNLLNLPDLFRKVDASFFEQTQEEVTSDK